MAVMFALKKLSISTFFILCVANGIGEGGGAISGIRDEISDPITVQQIMDTPKDTSPDEMMMQHAPKKSTKASRTEANPSGLRDEEIGTLPDNDEELGTLLLVAKQLSQDPLALTSSVLLIAYLCAQLMINPRKKPATEDPALSQPPRGKKTKVMGKSQFAVSINQKLMALHTWDELLETALSFQGRTDVVNVVTAVHRSTKLALQHGSARKLTKDPRLAVLLEQLRQFLAEEMPVTVRTRAVGNTSWALAKLSYREEGTGEDALLNLLQDAFVTYGAQFKPEELMNTVWAFAELSRDAKENEDRALKVAKAAVLCSGRFPDFTLQQVVYFSWALARLSTVSAVRADAEVVTGLLGFKRLIVERAAPEIASLTTKNLAMVSWATAHLHKVRPDSSVPVNQLLAAVAGDASRRGLQSFAAGELASIVWALSKCQVSHAGFYQLFRAHLKTNGTTGFSSQDLANVLCAFVNAEAGDDATYQVLADACAKNRNFNRLEKTMVNWAFTQLPRIPAPKLQ